MLSSKIRFSLPKCLSARLIPMETIEAIKTDLLLATMKNLGSRTSTFVVRPNQSNRTHTHTHTQLLYHRIRPTKKIFASVPLGNMKFIEYWIKHSIKNVVILLYTTLIGTILWRRCEAKTCFFSKSNACIVSTFDGSYLYSVFGWKIGEPSQIIIISQALKYEKMRSINTTKCRYLPTTTVYQLPSRSPLSPKQKRKYTQNDWNVWQHKCMFTTGKTHLLICFVAWLPLFTSVNSKCRPNPNQT